MMELEYYINFWILSVNMKCPVIINWFSQDFVSSVLYFIAFYSRQVLGLGGGRYWGGAWAVVLGGAVLEGSVMGGVVLREVVLVGAVLGGSVLAYFTSL